MSSDSKSSPLSTISCNVVDERSPSCMKQKHEKSRTAMPFADRIPVEECKENEEPINARSGDEEDDEVFFGVVTDKEKSKMTKLRRRTQVFVSNFRNLSWGSGTDSLDESWSSRQSRDSNTSLSSPSTECGSLASYNASILTDIAEGADTQPHPKPSQPATCRIASSSSLDSPSVLAHRAAAKIQTWFRLTRQAQEYRGAMREVQRLEEKTDDFIQEIRREKERIRQCSTPEQGHSHRDGRLDTVLSSPMVMVPGHRLHLTEISPQESADATVQQASRSPTQLCQDDTEAVDVVFNATDDSNSISATKSGYMNEGSTCTIFCPSKVDEVSFKLNPTRAKNLQTNPTSTTSGAKRKGCGTPKLPVKQSLQYQDHAVDGRSFFGSPSFAQSGCTSRASSVCSEGSLYRGANTKVASAVKSQAFNQDPFSLLGTPSRLGNIGQTATNSPACLQVGRWLAHTPGTPVQPLQVNLTAGILSSFPRVPYEQIQSPTVFSSPRLFPTTIQAVQSQQSVPSSTLFSPLKLADHKLVKDCSHSDALTSFDVQGTELQTSQKTTERENDKSVFDFDSQQLPGLNVATVKEDSDCSTHHRMSDFTTSSAPSDGVQMSPNIGFRRYAPKVAIVTPGSAPNMPDISAQEAQSSRSVLEYKSTLPADMGSRKQLGTTQKGTHRSHHFFPSPAVRDSLGIQTLATSLTSPTADVQDSLNAARPEIGDEGQLCIKTSPYVGPRSCGSARSKPELLEQKKAELARLRAEKAQLKKTLKTENELCFAMKQEIQAALRSNTSQTNLPKHLLSLGCQGISSLTLTDQELDIVTRLHTIRNSRHGNMQGLTASPVVTQTPTERDKGSLHLRWHSSLVTEVQYLSSPGHPVRVARPILAKQGFSRARHVPVTRTASPAQ